MSDPFVFSIPEEFIERVAARVMAKVLQELRPPENGDSPYLTIVEAAELLRAKRHRVDDLLSKGVLTRVKDGSRTLVARRELEDYLAGRPTGRAGR